MAIASIIYITSIPALTPPNLDVSNSPSDAETALIECKLI